MTISITAKAGTPSTSLFTAPTKRDARSYAGAGAGAGTDTGAGAGFGECDEWDEVSKL